MKGIEELLGIARDEPFRADLHVHTTVSDGSETVEAVVSAALAAGLTHIALTNHDTTVGLRAAKRAGDALGIRVVGGVEISAFDSVRSRKVHILGLGLDEGSPAVRRLCAPLLARREECSRAQLAAIVEAGHRVDVRTVERLASSSTCLYKQHIMAGITDAPASSVEWQRLYRALFGEGGVAARDLVYVDAVDAVRAIVRDGGAAVLAHPGQTASYDLVPTLVEAGLSGIELAHPDHSERDHDLCFNLAERFGLFTTGGSDYHGRFGRSLRVGSCVVEARRCDPRERRGMR